MLVGSDSVMPKYSPEMQLDPYTPKSILIIEHGRLPSTDYYILPHFQQYGMQVCTVDSNVTPPAPTLLQPGTLVVFVRYVERHWAQAVAKHRENLADVVYFMDDDLLDSAALRGLPLRYQWKIRTLCLSRRQWLQQMNATLWVSTDWLATKYAHMTPVLIAPSATGSRMQRQELVRVFYHGTAAHSREIAWLHPIIRKVQETCDHTSFEIIGDRTVNRMYAGIPRVAVLHPMGWENYVAHCASTERHIGLAPLLNSPFNAARSHIKFFDFARCHAAGIFSDRVPYSPFVKHGIDGLLVSNEPDAWVAAIELLANDGQLRERLASAASSRIQQQQRDPVAAPDASAAP